MEFTLSQPSIMTQPMDTKEMVTGEKTSSSGRSAEAIDAVCVDEAQSLDLNIVNAEYTEAD